MLTLGNITKFKSAVEPPGHHVIAASTAEAASGWTSYIPSWAPSPARTRPSLSKSKVAGFRNPWPSWHRPTAAEKWDSFQWGDDDDGCIELAASHLTDNTPPQRPPQSKQPRFSDINDWPSSLGAKAARLLRLEDPDFSFPEGSKAKATWLGHAGVLVQLPPLDPQNSRPVRCLFDPMFSARCSPSQLAGPIRSYPPPCTVQDLPPIDAVFISHNHYDHMDYDSLIAVWRHSRDSVRFFVPLGNKKLLLEWGIPADRVTEMDWWDSAELTLPSSSATASSRTLKVWCTPAQHNSFRTAGDADSTLWSSWLVEDLSPTEPPYRVFFAGDTGYQFHADPSWPPSPNNPAPQTPDDEKEKFPACPAFAEIRTRIGPPNLLLLPVSVGATFAYLRSFVPLPNWINPFPRHSAGVTGANHMPPWDAVEVLRVMTRTEGRDGGDGEGAEDGEPAVALAMHWGTFVTDPGEVLKTLGGLEFACKQQGVRFARELSELESADGVGGGGGQGREPVFVAVNQGGSVCV
ncbi:beta-lactamase superfamily domain-containing protein [Parachaetomium inaequale]|uniref:Beta-lactamase superfamily domain-containing protein n=1 Tax=Parachaetomium inaequale TaxID=2588326 RepID=A0AAN6PLP0_9PEZI|nr:beta-lactamase superfamily domain-containing protein [Parachaetomium inaequale]